MHLVITARTEGGLAEVDDEIQAAGGSATLLPLDLLDGAGVDMIGPSIFDRFGRLDVLVHNAAALGTADAGGAHHALGLERRGGR